MATLTSSQLDALCRSASAGIRFDGLLVEETADGYRFEAGSTSAAGLDEDGLRRSAERASEYVANWFYWDRVVDAPAPGRAFLRWLERADVAGAAQAAGSPGAEGESLSVPDRHARLREGIDREWGQLSIEGSLRDDGRRRYRLRHTADAGQDEEESGDREHLSSVRALAAVVTEDDRGRYRPLKTAPTLPSGWVLPGLGPAALLDAVGEVYPATVENWHREREGRLDVDHYRETARRQTGIYDVVEELPREALEWVAEACCVDSQCLKRRAWDEAPGDELDVPRGKGKFPCREPCSLLIAAAREWTRLEREDSEVYEFELTPSERAQLDDLIDAVADGRTDEIREADLDEGANRYRARYLRAKRFDGETLSEAGIADETSRRSTDE